LDFHHPAVQSVLLPLLLASILTGAIRLFGGKHWGARLASVAITITLLIAFVQLLGVSPWVPRTGMQKLFYVIIMGLIVSIVVEIRVKERSRIFFAGIVWLTLSYLWLAWPQLKTPNLSLLAQFGIVYLAASLSFWRLAELREQNLTPVVMILLAAIGLAGVAFVSGSLSIAQLAITLAAAIGGFALWNWPDSRFPLRAAGVIAVGVALLALVAVTFLLTDASPIALIPLIFIFFANTVSRRLPAGTGRLRQALEPIYLALTAAVPVALAIVLAQVLAETDSAYYY
jgi:hypothetical protein